MGVANSGIRVGYRRGDQTGRVLALDGQSLGLPRVSGPVSPEEPLVPMEAATGKGKLEEERKGGRQGLDVGAGQQKVQSGTGRRDPPST